MPLPTGRFAPRRTVFLAAVLVAVALVLTSVCPGGLHEAGTAFRPVGISGIAVQIYRYRKLYPRRLPSIES